MSLEAFISTRGHVIHDCRPFRLARSITEVTNGDDKKQAVDKSRDFTHLPVVKIFFLTLTCVKELISSTISLMFVYRKPTMRIPR